jgi:hypothetical protein
MIPTSVGLLSLALIGAGFAGGTSITFTESATASGTLGSTPFTNTLVTFTASGDTSNVTEDAPQLFDINGLTISINIASLDTTATLNDTVYSFQGDDAAGFSDGPGGGIILETSSDEIGRSYDLTTSMGPITGVSYINSGFEVGTNEGLFDFTSAGNATFTATVGGAPEPTTMALFGLGLAGLAALTRRRQAADDY